MILPFRLNVKQFAVCTQRSIEHVRREIRDGNIEADGPPYLIHPNELNKCRVDAELALARLKSVALDKPDSPVG